MEFLYKYYMENKIDISKFLYIALMIIVFTLATI